MNAHIKKEIKLFEQKVAFYKKNDLKIYATSSFQSHSLPMLHIISQIDNSIPVYFLNTGFHFPELYLFKNKIKKLFNINVLNIESPVPKLHQRDENNHFLYTSDPDYCCYLNKTLPTENLLKQYDVWINGVRKDQNENRKNMNKEEKSKYGTIRFQPMLNWNNKMILEYIKINNLPKNPLEEKGYVSIGCRPCTEKFNFETSNDVRNSRWKGLNKTECGLHTELIERK